MRALLILLALATLGGCSHRGPINREHGPVLVPRPDREVIVNDELRKKWDKKTVEYIKKNRQLVYLAGGWQVMAYCTRSTVNKSQKADRHGRYRAVVCEPPKARNRDEVLGAWIYVLASREKAKYGTPVVWKVRFMNRSPHHVCAVAQWKFIDVEADSASSGWHYLSPYTIREQGKLEQMTWNIKGRTLAFDFWGHVNSLYIRKASDDGTCEGDVK